MTREDSRDSWSPDSKVVAFNSDRAGDMNIWPFTLADSSARQLTTGHGGDFQPNWSPDEKKIAFFSSRSESPNIWEMEIASGTLSRLTSNSGVNVNRSIRRMENSSPTSPTRAVGLRSGS